MAEKIQPSESPSEQAVPVRPEGISPRSSPLVLGLAVAVNLVLVLYTALVTLQRFPNAGDEYAYLISGELFSTGRLSVPSPPDSPFFNFNHILNDGRYYSKYPPGWPFLLMFGILAHAPWLLNPIFGASTLILFWFIVRKHFSDAAAVYVALLLMVNPFYVFNSASFFSHSSCLFFVTLCLYGALNWRDHPDSIQHAAWAGFGAGMAFLIRPFSAVLVLAPLGIAMLRTGASVRSSRRALLGLGCALLFLAAAVAVYCLYNDRLTGSPFLQPFTKYDPTDHPRLPVSLGQLGSWISKFSGAKALELNWPWLPFSLVFFALLWVVPSLRNNGKARLLCYCSIMWFVGYSFYPGDGGIGYGPRYAYESMVGIVPVMGLVYARFPRIAPYVLAVTLAINCIVFVTYTRMTAGVIREKKGVYEAVQRDHLENAIVFIRAGSGVTHPGDLTRNGIRFDGNVLYVLDRERDNVRLRRAFPARKAYLYVLNSGEVPGPLEPLTDLR